MKRTIGAALLAAALLLGGCQAGRPDKSLYQRGLEVVALMEEMAGSPTYLSLFSSNEELTMLTCRYMPVYFLGITIFGIQMGCQTTFLALGQAKISLFIATFRKVILLVPLALILPLKFGVMGIYYAEPISDFTSATVAVILFLTHIKKIVSRETLEKIG